MVELLALIVGAIALAGLWRRVERLEAMVRRLDAQLRPPAPAVEPIAVEVAEPAQAAAGQPARPVLTLPRFALEDLFGRRLPIWAGGITLAVAGVLIVRYSIEAGLLSPTVRVLLGLAFGVVLIAGAELARRQAGRVRDPRVAQALAGAGTATLYASVLIAANLYGLVGGAPAFAGLAAVTALAMAMALRFGAPSALLGLVGGLAAPALVSAGPTDVPLLSGYLALTVGALTMLSRAQRWLWLGIGALAGGGAWSLALIATAPLDQMAAASIGLLVLLVGVALPSLAPGGAGAGTVRAAAGAAAAIQMAVLVATGGFAPLTWGLFALLSAALVWLAAREPALRSLPAIGLGIVLLLAAAWPDPDPGRMAVVLAVLGAIYGGGALRALWRDEGGLIEAGQVAGLPLGVLALALFHHAGATLHGIGFAGLALGLALVPVGGLVVARRVPGWQWDRRAVLLIASATLMVACAAMLALPGALTPAVLAGGLVGTAVAARRIGARPAAPAAAVLVALLLAWAAPALLDWLVPALRSLAGEPMLANAIGSPARAFERLAAPGMLMTTALAVAWPTVPPPVRRAAAPIAAAMMLVGWHVLAKQVFAIGDATAFVRLGLAERVVWEALLLGAAFVLARWSRAVALELSAIATAHALLYTALLHDPLWALQAVGPVPLANLLVPGFGLPLAGLWLARRMLDAPPRWLLRAIEAARIALVTLLGFALLRQAFHGSLVAIGGTGQAEEIARSVLAIALAIGFLLWGIARGQRTWRIASLLLMVAAVAKVFLFDVSGLDGLLRIASFVALGFSLIAIGWLYSRQLGIAAGASSDAAAKDARS